MLGSSCLVRIELRFGRLLGTVGALVLLSWYLRNDSRG